MNIDLLIDIVMPIITLIVGIFLEHFLENREKLISHLGHIASHKLSSKADNQNSTIVHTHSVVIRNVGRKAAKNVRLGHNYLPDFNVFPDTEYSVNTLPNGSKEILFPTIIPKKEITISYLYFPPLTWSNINTHIESDEGPAKVVQVLLQQQVNPIILKSMWLFIILGFATTIYFVISFLKWLL